MEHSSQNITVEKSSQKSVDINVEKKLGKKIEKTVENDDKENCKTDFREEILWILLGTFRGLLDDRKVITV